MKKLAEAKRKATAKSERDKIRKQAAEIVANMQEKQRAEAREKYQDLLASEHGSRSSSQPRADQSRKEGSVAASDVTGTMDDNPPDSEHDGDNVPDDGEAPEQSEDNSEVDDVDASGRRISPPGVPAKEPRKEGQQSVDKSRKDRLQALNNKIREMERDNTQVLLTAFDISSVTKLTILFLFRSTSCWQTLPRTRRTVITRMTVKPAPLLAVQLSATNWRRSWPPIMTLAQPSLSMP